jgi:hypothetical protein
MLRPANGQVQTFHSLEDLQTLIDLLPGIFWPADEKAQPGDTSVGSLPEGLAHYACHPKVVTVQESQYNDQHIYWKLRKIPAPYDRQSRDN